VAERNSHRRGIACERSASGWPQGRAVFGFVATQRSIVVGREGERPDPGGVLTSADGAASTVRWLSARLAPARV